MASGFDLHELTNYEKHVIKTAQNVFPKESKQFLKKNANDLSKIQKKEFKKVPMDKVEKAEREMVKAYRKGFRFDGHFKGKARTYTLKTMKSGKVGKNGNTFYCKAGGRGILNLVSKGYWHKGGFSEKNGIETYIKGFDTVDNAAGQFEGTYYKNCSEFVDNIGKDL